MAANFMKVFNGLSFTGLPAAPANPANGDIYYDSTLLQFRKYENGSWIPMGGTGDVVGPASATNNAIARFDTTTGKLLKNSGVTVSDTDGIIAGSGGGTSAFQAQLNINAQLVMGISQQTITGSLQTLANPTTPVVELTGAGLVSIHRIATGANGQFFILKNFTGADVVLVNQAAPSGGNIPINTGTGSDLTLANNACIILHKRTSTSEFSVVGGSGGGAQSVKVTAGENIAINQPVYISQGAADGGRTAGLAYLLDVTNDNRMEFIGFAKAATLSGAQVEVVFSGIQTGFSSLTPGQPVYADQSAPGAVTQTVPTTSSTWSVIIGHALSTTTVRINTSGASAAIFIDGGSGGPFTLANNQVAATDITGMLLNGGLYRSALIDYTIYRNTTGGGATELSECGVIHAAFKTAAGAWAFSQAFGGDNSGVTLTITAAGQFQYVSTNITGTADQSYIKWNVRQVFGV